MKSLIGFLVVLLIALAVTTQLQFAPCGEPHTYKIGTIDARFNKTQVEFLEETKKGEQIWGSYEAVMLFAYDPAAELTVNLVYDERQGLVNQINNLDSKLQNEKESLAPEVAEYRARVRDFKTRLKNFNDRVAYWNGQGGAPSEEYQKLIDEQKELKSQADTLNSQAYSLNQSTTNYNTHVAEFNQTLNTYQKAIDLKPEQGQYDPEANTIDIYFITNPDEHIHTLAHEFGHVLGIEHVQNEASVMFPYSSETTKLSEEDRHSLAKACEKHSYFDIAVTRWMIFIELAADEINNFTNKEAVFKQLSSI